MTHERDIEAKASNKSVSVEHEREYEYPTGLETLLVPTINDADRILSF